MSRVARVSNIVRVQDTNGPSYELTSDVVGITCGTLLPKREFVTVTASAFTAFTVPSGAQHLVIRPGTSIKLTLKGVTGDTGVVITPTSNPTGAETHLSLGASPSVGLTSAHSSDQTVELIWL